MKRTIGIDLGVTSASRIAVADGATITQQPAGAQQSGGADARDPPRQRRRAVTCGAGEHRHGVVRRWRGRRARRRRAHPLPRQRPQGRCPAAFYRAHTKTDRIDAPVLARMPLVDDALRAFTLPSASELALKRLVTYRRGWCRKPPAARAACAPSCTGPRPA
jgi:hypothetical protein